MQAIVTPTTGEIRLIDAPVPTPTAGQVPVAVAAAAINPVDRQTVQGIYHELGWIDQAGPTGLGWDAAGTVTAVGEGVDHVRVGDEVALVQVGVNKPLGTFATHVAVEAASVALLPEAFDGSRLPLTEASTLPLNGLTAWQALDLLGEPNGTLLVTGAAGAVGALALPLATARGWTVLGLARDTDREFVESSGARLVTDLAGLGVNAVLDAAVLPDESLAVVVDGGRYVGVVPPAIPSPRRRIVPVAVNVQPNLDQLRAVLDLGTSGRLNTRIAATHPLRDAEAAFAASAASGLRGRVVLVSG